MDVPTVKQDAVSVLRGVFGYPEFRSHQGEIVDHLVAGGDALVLMPTGGGKSLCYQVPALVRPGTAVVISPLIALMQDQVSALLQLGVKAACLNSSLDQGEAMAVEASFVRGELDLLYVAPERLLMPRMLELLDAAAIALFAIDEAHCVAQWGHDFRPEYIRLSVLHERYPQVPRIALTATADDRTRGEIVQRLALDEARLFISSFDRPNIRYRIAENQGNAREQLLRFITGEHRDEAGIVYCLSRKKVDETAAWLCARGLTALPYHAGLDPRTRQANQERFLRDDGVIIVATIAFGMGIDKPDVRFVAHLNLPKSIEAYYQETGRGGRDGLAADAWMSYGLQDVITLRQMQEMSTAAEAYKRVERHKLDAMLGLCEMVHCRRQALLRYFGEDLPQPCGNCDNCLSPPQTWDATVAAQKALSCVYRTGQRFGVNYLIEVLQGKNNERVTQFGHDRISTFGIGREHTASEWRSLFRQLIAAGYLRVDVEGHGSVMLTETARPLLKGEQRLELRKQAPAAQVRSRGVRGAQLPSGGRLWTALRALRKTLAEEQGVPAYVIFHDATLADMAERQPLTLDQMRLVSGVGQRKLEAYGERFVEAIRATIEPAAPLPDTAAASIALLCQGLTPLAIAHQRDLTLATVYRHLARGVESGELELADICELSPDELRTIEFAFEHSDDGRLKPVYDALEGRYDYGLLDCVRAALQLKAS